ncbi:HalOD1 output domain-containing protein [Haloprofundus salinisoli]|uniref:HalOD1 output domain-containing protein n=1 Tax=Haloprofundus salinisoli TaxID=2876193 RepID=UPI001CCCE5F4|nr:HalOD1 output domain-containing protein [Haloprofundus salinisoli]
MTEYSDDRTDSFGHRITEESYQTFPIAGEPVSEVVVRAVASTVGCDPLELDQLYGTVNPDALDDLFTDGSPGSSTVDGQFVFSFNDCEVVISPDVVAVRPLDD